jgi:lysophospholipase L1-like esterase
MADTIRIRRGTTSAWNAANPVLALGEQGYDTTTKQYKVGDGTTAWTSLAYSTPGHIAAGTVLANPSGVLANPVGVDAAGMRTLIGADAVVKRRPVNQWKSVSSIGNSLFENSLGLSRTAIGFLGVPMHKNFGVGGAATSALAAQAANVPTGTACLVMEGTNDAAAGVTVSTHIANMKAAVAILLSRGVTPIVIASPPRDTTTALIDSYSVAERVWCIDEGLYFCDPWGKLTDTDGTWTSGASSDGDHPTNAAYYTAGKMIADQLLGIESNYWVPRTNSNVLSNPLCLTDGDTNNRPDGWAGFSLPTFSALATGTHPIRGNRALAVISQSATMELYHQASVSPGVLQVGDEILITGLMSLANMSNCLMRVYSQENSFFLTQANQPTVIGLQSRFVVTGNVQVWIEARSLAGGAFTCDLTFGCFSILNLTRNRY